MTKKELRRQLRAQPLCPAVLRDDLLPAGHCVMLFWPLPDEVDTRPFIRQLHAAQVEVVLPVVVGDDIELRRYEGDDSLRPGAFGILEPQGKPFCDLGRIERIYVPGMAFTPDGRRIGRGRGYYDRFLQRLEAEGYCPELVGVCAPDRLLPDLPTEPHDRRVHRVLQGLLSFFLMLVLGTGLMGSCKRRPAPENPAFAQTLDTTGAADPYIYEGDSAYDEAIAIHRVQDNWRLRQQRHRRVRAPYINKEKGIISAYDDLFKEVAAQTGWDWRLIAAQCYQESGFDPDARSGAGARGLMQIMPATARQLGLSMADIHKPAANMQAAGRYLHYLSGLFRDIRSSEERTHFVLAAYNGGYNHIRDAMALCRKYGGSAQRWQDVSRYVLGLQQPRYYRDPVVKHGYMIGSETTGYVANIVQRARQYGANLASVSLPPGWKAFSLGGKPHKDKGDEQAAEDVRRRPTNRFTRGNSTVKRPEELEKSVENPAELQKPSQKLGQVSEKS